ncbi:hypothetical protein SUGI_1059440 [Cryptomeria japonica]|uniref:hydroquinone glucosyltransferase n=1 Tax=Cryptomeria japonica TaxID=3369 RepID=UPI002414CDFF|nr:hydroquinone glucosyltransferase [Cryptomeria japonica]GLJ49858.1 hypothetical protein SUGI_1059440 [Cryptomeria japonica]
MGSRTPHIAVFPSWGMGHLLPSVEFAKRMSIHHGFAVTFITPPALTADIRSLASSLPDIRFLDLSVPHLDSLPMNDPSTWFAAMEEYKGPVKHALGSLKDELSAFVIDFFCAPLIEASTALNIPTYVLSTVSASRLCFMLFHDTLHSQTTESLKDMDGAVTAPGLPSMPSRYFPNAMQDRTQPLYHLLLRNSRLLCTADGILMNTFHDLESGSIRALIERKHELLPKWVKKGPEIYPIGPLIRCPDAGHEKRDCLEWLDRQPDASVMFVSFGSTNWFLSPDQTRELALGLEASGYPFLWVLRSDKDVSALLPPGFEMRTRDRGLVWTSWAPQIPILSHPATGGFVSHCGWNSTLESVTSGLPIVVWPVRAEQKTNAFFLVNEIGLGIEPEWGPNWWVGKDEVERAVRELMEGEKGRKVRMRAAELKESARKAVAAGGSSMDVLTALAAQWKNRAS